jgi:hypothetical protein
MAVLMVVVAVFMIALLARIALWVPGIQSGANKRFYESYRDGTPYIRSALRSCYIAIAGSLVLSLEVLVLQFVDYDALAGAFAVLFFLCAALNVTIVLWNQPSFIVPRPLRDEPGRIGPKERKPDEKVE